MFRHMCAISSFCFQLQIMYTARKYTPCFIISSGISEVCSSETNSPTGDESVSVKRVNNQASLLRNIFQAVTWDISNSRLARCVDFWGLLVKILVHCPVSGDGPGLPALIAAHKHPVSSNFLYHFLIVLSIGGSVWYLVRKPRSTVIIDLVLASFKTKRFLFSWKRHISTLLPPSGKRVTKPWHKTQEENDIILFTDSSHPLWASLSLSYSRPKSRRELWNKRYCM
jgi:hypothetical protein